MQIKIEVTKANVKRLLVVGLTFLGALAVVPAYGALPFKFAEKTLLTAEQLNKNFDALDQRGAFCGATSTYDGNFKTVKSAKNGYVSAALICQAEAGNACKTSHLCSASELAVAVQAGVDVPSGWFASATYAYTATPSIAVDDCGGWTSAAANAHQAAYWSGQAVSVASCNNTTLPLLCCY